MHLNLSPSNQNTYTFRRLQQSAWFNVISRRLLSFIRKDFDHLLSIFTITKTSSLSNILKITNVQSIYQFL